MREPRAGRASSPGSAGASGASTVLPHESPGMMMRGVSVGRLRIGAGDDQSAGGPRRL
jgi:hypothetical protein